MRRLAVLAHLLLAPVLPAQTVDPVAAWIDRLDDPDWSVRRQAERALVELGAAARPALEARSKDPSPEVRGRIASILARLNLIRNGGFEAYDPSSGGDPAEWVCIGATVHTAVGGGGIGAEGIDDLFAGVRPHEGWRWISGFALEGGVREVFGQTLTDPLEPGRRYVLTAWLHGAAKEGFAHPGTFEVALGASLEATLALGRFEPVAGGEGWARRTIEFTAPDGCGDHPWIVFTATRIGKDDASPAIDAITLERVP